MNHLVSAAHPALALVAFLLALPVLLYALRGLRPALADPITQHVWLAAIVLVALLWLMPVNSPVGIEFGLLGSALFAVTFGFRRAVAGLSVAVVLHTLVASGAWLNVGINVLLLAVVPAWIATSLQIWIGRTLPKNIFVFIFGNGLAVTLLTTAFTGLLLLAVGGWIGGVASISTDHVAYALLLAWGEALLSGMLLSSLVIFLPRTVPTFDQDMYLPRPPRPR